MPENGKELAVLQGHTGRVNSAAFSNDGTRVVTTSWDGTARIWDAESATVIAVLKGVQNVAFSRDGKKVVTASEVSTQRIWDVTWATLVRGDILRERVCAEKLIGAAQEFTDGELKIRYCAVSTRTIRLHAIRACAAVRCRSTTGQRFRPNFGVRRAGWSA